MANYPKSFTNKQTLQPGARGEKFTSDLPGYRNQGDRINRTYTHTNMSDHDVLNNKYILDERLQPLFRYGYAVGYNQIVIPKNRIVAVDPHVSRTDFETRVDHNVLTLANGGVPVRLRKDSDKYFGKGGSTELVSTEAQGQEVAGIGKEWVPVAGMDKAYNTKCYRPFIDNTSTADVGTNIFAVSKPGTQLTTAGYSIDVNTGLVIDGDDNFVDVIPGNVPVGVMERNEYTRDDDAFNGIMPGAIRTDTHFELAWFAYKDKAEGCFWGSVYGDVYPGALLKSDENGRLTISPLSYESEIETMSLLEYELERQQVVGQVTSAQASLIPEGAARWATWTLEERMNFEGFNPTVWRETNRRGEDSTNNSPYRSDGKYPGFGLDNNISEHDLHMLASTARGYSMRMDPKWQYENLGIPGLTDGYNAVTRDYENKLLGVIRKASAGVEYADVFLKLPETNVEKGTISLTIGTKNFPTVAEGQLLNLTDANTPSKESLKVKYLNEEQGIIVLEIINRENLEETLLTELEVKASFKKRGLAGVPTFLDWDGAVGIVKVLLTK